MAIYNNPALGESFENIASMFAPPSAGDLAGYSTAALNQQKRSQLAQLFGSSLDPSEQAALVGIQDYGQTPKGFNYNVDQDNATSRSNNAADNARAVQTNTLDNQTKLALPRFSPLSPGEVLPPVQGSLASQFGMPGDLGAVAGPAKPMSAEEVKGQELLRLIGEGDITDEMQVDTYQGQNTPVKIVGPDGKATYASPGAALGEQAYINEGATAKPENALAQMPDGTRVPAVQGEDGRWLHAQTGQPLPADIQIFKIPQPQGSASDVGLGKPTANFIDRSLIDIAVAKDTAVKLRGLIATSPASQGLVGWLRGTAQNVVQTGGELGTYFGGQMADVAKAINEGAADAGLAGAFDPNIPAIEMMANLLAFQYAKTTTGERLSNEMLKAARAALGLDGLDANQANSLARLDQAIAQIASQESILKRAKGEGVDALSTPQAVEGVPEGIDPADWAYLTPDEQAEFLNGQ